MKRIIALAISLTAAVIMIAFMARVLPPGAASILLDINRVSWPFTVQNVLWLAFFAGLGELSIRWHAGRIEALQRRTASHPGLALAGNAYHGVGLADCVRDGEDATDRMLAHLLDTPTN